VLRKSEPLFRDLASKFLFITAAGEDGEAGILGKVKIGVGKITKDEHGAPSGFDGTGVNTVSA
jgi:hypothetical protein